MVIEREQKLAFFYFMRNSLVSGKKATVIDWLLESSVENRRTLHYTYTVADHHSSNWRFSCQVGKFISRIFVSKTNDFFACRGGSSNSYPCSPFHQATLRRLNYFRKRPIDVTTRVLQIPLLQLWGTWKAPMKSDTTSRLEQIFYSFVAQKHVEKMFLNNCSAIEKKERSSWWHTHHLMHTQKTTE